jgi:heme exporter protein A
VLAAVVTISSSVARGERDDRSGAELVERCRSAGLDTLVEVVRDDRDEIARTLVRLADERAVRFIFTTGGTGMTPDDVTPEATLDAIEREAPGYAESIRAEARRHTPLGILTRGVAGIRGRTLIVNFPGSPRSIGESWPVVAPTLEIAGLERRYGERPALEGVTLELPAGETLAVLGPNGAGKTTLLRVLATLLRPHAGSARVLGARLPAEAWKVRARVGYVGHEPLVYRDLTVRENLRFYARLYGVEDSRADELIAAVELAARDRARELSRGMLQRLAVARAVLHDPPLLLLDEPRAGLDPGAVELLEPLMGASSGRTRVIVSHDPESAVGEADCALGLRNGRQEFFGQPTAAAVRGLYE